MAPTGFVRAQDTVTGRTVTVPEAFLGDRSPFPHLKPLPSGKRKSAATSTPDTAPTSTAGKSRRSTTGRQTKAAAHNKE